MILSRIKQTILKRFIAIRAILSLLIATGCGAGKEEEAQAIVSQSSVSQLQPAQIENPEPIGKYTPELTINMVHQSGDQTVKFKDGDSFENNVFTRAYKDVSIDTYYSLNVLEKNNT